MKKINNYIVEKLHIGKDVKLNYNYEDEISFEVAAFCKSVLKDMPISCKYINMAKDSVIIEFNDMLNLEELDDIIYNIKNYIRDNKSEEYNIDCKIGTTVSGMKKVSIININITQ